MQPLQDLRRRELADEVLAEEPFEEIRRRYHADVVSIE